MNNEAGLYQYITSSYVLAGVKMSLGLRESTAEDGFLLDSINQGLKELRNFGTQRYYITQIEVDHTSDTPKAKLPDGFIRFVKQWPIVYVNASGGAVPGIDTTVVTSSAVTTEGSNLGTMTTTFPIPYIPFSSPSYVGNTFFENSPFPSSWTFGGTVNVVQGYLYFSSDVIADYVKIAYLGSVVDDNGNLSIPSYCEMAVRYWTCREWCTMMYAVTGDPKYDRLSANFTLKYSAHKKKAKAIAVIPDSMEYGLINYIMHTLV